MLIAAATKGGRKLLIVGLDDENIQRLKNDEPIYKDLRVTGVEGLEEWDLTILGPEDMARLVARVGPQTKGDMMDDRGLIYRLTDDEQQALLKPAPLDVDAEAKAEFDRLREDTARLDGYLRGRADSDRPKREHRLRDTDVAAVTTPPGSLFPLIERRGL